MPMLWGRYGPYKPRTPAEKAKARQQAEARRQAQQRRQAWLERYNTCLNGCRQASGFLGRYSSVPALRGVLLG